MSYLLGVSLANNPTTLPRNCNCDRMQKAVSRGRIHIIMQRVHLGTPPLFQ